MSDIPNWIEELDRKTIAALDNLFQRHASKELTDREFAIGVESVFATAAGLTSPDVDKILLQAAEFKAKPAPRVEVYCAGESKKVQIIAQGRGKETLVVVTAQVEKASKHKKDDWMTASKVYDALGEKLVAAGYKRFG